MGDNKFIFYTLNDIEKFPIENHNNIRRHKDIRKKTGKKWWIQNTYEDKNGWKLSCDTDDDPPYCMEVFDMRSILHVIAHLNEKEWVDMGRLVIGLMPAINFYAHKCDKN